ncbi:MAG: hypothetical protein ACE5GK_05815 [Nitrospiria bacterium]
MKNVVVAAILVSILSTLLPSQASAQNNGVMEVLESSFYGGLTGTLVGAAFLAFRDKPGDHLKDLRVGAGVGVILGTVYGIAKTASRSFAEINDGMLSFHVPRLKLDIDASEHSVRGSVDLLNISF